MHLRFGDPWFRASCTSDVVLKKEVDLAQVQVAAQPYVTVGASVGARASRFRWKSTGAVRYQSRNVEGRRRGGRQGAAARGRGPKKRPITWRYS